jgi:hypothetical protein
MSEDETESCSMSIPTASSDDSFSDIQEQLEGVTEVVNAFTQEIALLEKQLETLQRPMEALELGQLGDIPFLTTTPFRHATFLVKPPGFHGIDLEARYPFHTICSMLRNYLFKINAVKQNGLVTLNKELQVLFGTEKTETTYLNLLQMLRNVLI